METGWLMLHLHLHMFPIGKKTKRGMGNHYFLKLIIKIMLLHTSLSSFLQKVYFSQGWLQPFHTREVLELHGNRELEDALQLALHWPASYLWEKAQQSN